MNFVTCGIRWLSHVRAAWLGALCALLWSTAGLAQNPGVLDPSFGTAGAITPLNFGAAHANIPGAVLLRADGSMLVAGTCETPDSVVCLTKLSATGQPNPAFGAAGVASPSIQVPGKAGVYYRSIGPAALVEQTDGKVLVSVPCDYFGTFEGQPVFGGNFMCLVRLLGNGTADATFNSAGASPGALVLWGFSTTRGERFPIALQSTGKIIVAGACDKLYSPMCVTRLLPSGALDITFANAASGNYREMTFGAQTFAWPRALEIDAADRIAIAGSCEGSNPAGSFACVGRLTSNGSTDSSFFIPAGGAGSWYQLQRQGSADAANDLRLNPDGSMVLLGDCGFAPATSTCLTRLRPDGTPDPAFTSTNSSVPGTVKFSLPDGLKAAKALLVQPDGKFVFAGECSSTFSLWCVGRANADGALDRGFSSLGEGERGIVQLAVGTGVGYVTRIAQDAAGKLVMLGTCRDPSYPYATACIVGLKGGPSACYLRADTNYAAISAQDAIPAVRYLLGIRGSALGADLPSQVPTRTGQALENYLTSLNLDADGDGQSLAMTDGLLMLRAMLGLTGDALTQGATNAAHPNVRNAQQILSWIELTHGVACLP